MSFLDLKELKINYADLPKDYKPSEKEEYMCDSQIGYFLNKLLSWREELLEESRSTLSHLKEENWQEADLSDRATVETDATIELNTRSRYRKLIYQIDKSILRIKNGEYGYCAETGDEIGLKRLEARPIAYLSIEAQERHEKYEKTHMDIDEE